MLKAVSNMRFAPEDPIGRKEIQIFDFRRELSLRPWPPTDFALSCIELDNGKPTLNEGSVRRSDSDFCHLRFA
jgi:hypothetical protein